MQSFNSGQGFHGPREVRRGPGRGFRGYGLGLALALTLIAAVAIAQNPTVLTGLSLDYLAYGTASTFTELDTTPDVSNKTRWNSGTQQVTWTNFDGSGVVPGQVLIIESKGPVGYDCTGSSLNCGTVDIPTESGDLATWFWNGTNWKLQSLVRQNADQSQ